MAKSEYDRLREDLKRQRDEIRLKIHLAGAEVRDEWTEIEKKWEHFAARADVVARGAGEAAEDVASAAKLLGEEIRSAYHRIRSLL
jgi:hypothetical protein